MNQTSLTSPLPVGVSAPGTRPRRIAVLSSSWHRDIVASATGAVADQLRLAAGPPCTTIAIEVPGAFEIPLHAQRLAASGSCDAIIACGLVVNGGIYRHEFVAAAVIDGLMRVQLDTGVPIFSAVLTPRDFHEHEEHHDFFRAHFLKKGREVADACVQTLDSLDRLNRLLPR